MSIGRRLLRFGVAGVLGAPGVRYAPGVRERVVRGMPGVRDVRRVSGVPGVRNVRIVLGVLCLLGMAAAWADPAASADSAWSPLPIEGDSESRDPLEQRGREVFGQRCAACHGEVPDEVFGPPFLPPMPGTQALEARYQGALPAALERRTDLTPEYIGAVVRDGLSSMPFFRPTEVSEEDLDALVAYLTREPRTAEE